MVATDNEYVYLSMKGPGNEECELIEDYPPTKALQQNCSKVHAYGNVSKCGMTPLLVTVWGCGIKAKGKGINGEVYLILLLEHVIPACGALMSKRPLVKAQHNCNSMARQRSSSWLQED